MFLSPLEQFQIFTLKSVALGPLDFSVTNAVLSTLLGLSFLFFVVKRIFDFNLSFVPNRWQIFGENLYHVVSDLINNNTGKKGQKYFPFIFTLFTLLLFFNASGLTPYSFTITSHLSQTLFLALTVFVGTVYICFTQHGSNMLSVFLPGGTPLALAFLLVPIEMVSYVFKPLSLSVRLFANMMAGHTLLKVIAGFAWSMLSLEGWFSMAYLLPLLILVILYFLELAVALIQAYVFTVLSCIYINDAITLH